MTEALAATDPLGEGGSAVPVTTVASVERFAPTTARGPSRYRHTLPGGEHIDALLVNNGVDVLVVTFHGALARCFHGGAAAVPCR